MAVKRLLLRKARKDREYFRRVILEHLDRLEKEEADGLKAELKKARGFPVGAIREWRGKKYIKKPNGKWSPKYESETRGAKVALAVIKRKITNAKDEREMMNIILENRDRFADKEGSPLPFVMELHEHIKAEQANREKRIKAGEPPKVIQTIVRDYGRKIMSEAAGTMTNILDTGKLLRHDVLVSMNRCVFR